MKRLVLMVAALMVPASSAELGILFDKQIGKSQTVAGFGKCESMKPSGYGIRGGISLLDLRVFELGLAATYHSKAKDDFEVAHTKIGNYNYQYVAVGVQLDWKFLVNFHAGVDLRREKLSTDALGVSGETIQTRPWLKAGIGFSLPVPLVSPFIRLEIAMAASKENRTDDADQVRKALAPQYQAALYGGIRF